MRVFCHCLWSYEYMGDNVHTIECVYIGLVGGECETSVLALYCALIESTHSSSACGVTACYSHALLHTHAHTHIYTHARIYKQSFAHDSNMHTDLCASADKCTDVQSVRHSIKSHAVWHALLCV